MLSSAKVHDRLTNICWEKLDELHGARSKARVPATTNNSTTSATITQGVLNVASPTVPKALANVPTLVEAVEMTPARDRSTPNTGNIWFGPLPGDGTQLRLLKPVDLPYCLSAPPGKKIDLSTIYIDVVTAGDGVVLTAVN